MNYKTTESLNKNQLQNELNRRFGTRFVTTEGCKTRRDIIKVYCNNCHKYENVEVGKLLNNSTCYNCKKFTLSRGENIIAEILKYNKIRFKTQYIIHPKGYKNWLRIDFYLPDYNTFIEFDGAQHYDSTTSYYTESGVKRDRLKDKYAKNHRIKMLRITTYKLFDISIIIGNSIKHNLKIPQRIKYKNCDLPVYKIYKYLRSHSARETIKEFSEYSLSKERLQALYRMYNSTPLEIKKFGKKRIYRFKNEKEFKDYLEKEYGNKYTILSSYKGTKGHLKIHCNKCGHTFKAYAHSLINPRDKNSGGCPYCAGNHPWTTDEIQSTIKIHFPLANSKYGQYKLLDPYKNSNSKIRMKCLKCGKEIYKSWHDLSHGHGCYCSSQRFGDGSDKRNIKEKPIF